MLDIGCGPVTDTIELAARAGPHGHVLRIDPDPTTITTAHNAAKTASVSEQTIHLLASSLAVPLTIVTIGSSGAGCRMATGAPQPRMAATHRPGDLADGMEIPLRPRHPHDVDGDG